MHESAEVPHHIYFLLLLNPEFDVDFTLCVLNQLSLVMGPD